MIFTILVILGVSFILSYVSYAYMIHKKEKQFALSTYSKWCIIVTNMMSFSLPFTMLLDNFKNHYMTTCNVKFTLVLQIQIIASTILIFNNIIVQNIYQVKFIKKLSERVRSVSTISFPLIF